MAEAEFVMPPCCSRCLAKEASESWMIKAESQERHPNEANVNIVTVYSVSYTHLTLPTNREV